MNLVLVPGLWLDGDSWSEVTRSLEAAGHTAHPVTLPGLESRDADRSGITLQDHIDAVIGIVDSLPDPVALVGHSGGGAIVYGVVDARPDRIVRAIYVDTGPLGNGGSIAPDLPAVNSEIPLPDWSMFEEEEVADLDETARREFREKAIPSPMLVASGEQALRDERRYEVPATVITSTFPSSCDSSSSRITPPPRSWPGSRITRSSTFLPGIGRNSPVLMAWPRQSWMQSTADVPVFGRDRAPISRISLDTL